MTAELPTLALHIAAQFCPAPKDIKPNLEGIRLIPHDGRLFLYATNGTIACALSFEHPDELCPVIIDVPAAPFRKAYDGGTIISPRHDSSTFDVEIVDKKGKITREEQWPYKLPDHLEDVVKIGRNDSLDSVGEFARWVFDPALMMIPLKIAQKWGDGKVFCLESSRHKPVKFRAAIDHHMLKNAWLDFVIMPILTRSHPLIDNDPHNVYEVVIKP